MISKNDTLIMRKTVLLNMIYELTEYIDEIPDLHLMDLEQKCRIELLKRKKNYIDAHTKTGDI